MLGTAIPAIRTPTISQIRNCTRGKPAHSLVLLPLLSFDCTAESDCFTQLNMAAPFEMVHRCLRGLALSPLPWRSLGTACLNQKGVRPEIRISEVQWKSDSGRYLIFSAVC